MVLIRKLSKPTAIFLSFYMLILACPYQSAWAAMIDTESILDVDRGRSPRDNLNNLLVREVNDIVNKLDQLPAGGVLGTLLIIAFLIFVILLFTDIAGYTDIFPFVKKK